MARIRYWIATAGALVAGALSGAIFQHLFRTPDKSTLVAPPASPFLTLLMVGTCTTMVSFLATLTIAIAYRINTKLALHRTPHAVVFVPWFASWVMLMVSVIKIGQLNGDARCAYSYGGPGPWCIGSGDAVMIGAYVVIVLTFLEGWVFWYSMWIEEDDKKVGTRFMIGNRAVVVDVTDPNAVSQLLKEGNAYYKAKLDADLAELEARHEQDRLAKQQVQEIQQAISAGKATQAPVSQTLPDLEAQAARFRSV
ncbi:hypothetical protein B0T16DRAFT_416903 [Cercophora newfieldiana]|uniref:Uncharacterized protein n=1 Tax=Cercophora newfieldiana TaxID=92897 RepID=A0AA39Y1B7_9PEZI|nr:hypothetical protein B0T16DRAFT_416903 [Cercophora newfieldiana]